MNPATIKLIATALSMKKEIKLIFTTFILICLLPIMAVVILTQAGIGAVSGALATHDPQTNVVDIYDPKTGAVVDHVEVSATWPVSGPVSLEFGQSSPFQLLHSGIDIASPTHEVGDPIVAFMSGTVIYANTTLTGFGKHVVIDHGHHITSTYAHLDSLNVKVGGPVEMGKTVIGTRGSTGWSTGPHLHFQINVFGIPVNPRTFLDGNP